MNISRDIIMFIAEDLMGTCSSLSSICDHFEVSEEDFSEENWELFNEIVFECECCGWWCEAGESNVCDGESICDDCYDEKNYEEGY